MKKLIAALIATPSPASRSPKPLPPLRRRKKKPSRPPPPRRRRRSQAGRQGGREESRPGRRPGEERREEGREERSSAEEVIRPQVSFCESRPSGLLFYCLLVGASAAATDDAGSTEAIATRFSRELAPERSRRQDFGIASRSARNSSSAAFARPSAGGDETATFNRSP